MLKVYSIKVLFMKQTFLVGLAAAVIGVGIGIQVPQGIVSAPVSVTTFKIKVPFDQWVLGFDSKEAKALHKANNITPIFRGTSIKNPKKVIVIHKSEPGAVKKLLSENKKMIESTGHIMSSTKTSNWTFE